MDVKILNSVLGPGELGFVFTIHGAEELSFLEQELLVDEVAATPTAAEAVGTGVPVEIPVGQPGGVCGNGPSTCVAGLKIIKKKFISENYCFPIGFNIKLIKGLRPSALIFHE